MSKLRRRELLTGLIEGRGEAAERVRRHMLLPQRRPPGALDEADFVDACTRCGKCVEACPHQAIWTFTDAAGELAGTPVLLPERRPCAMCSGFPCTTACTDGALRAVQGAWWSLGKVRIVEERCLAYRGPECGACVGLCPGGLVGMRLSAWKPVVEDVCIGCGACIAACPTDPAAIELEPLSPARSGSCSPSPDGE